MFNDIGVPMSDAEMSMLPPGQSKPHQQIMANSGVEMNITWAAAGAIASVGIGLWGANKSADAARAQAEAQNRAMDRQYEYDTAAWGMSKQKLVADRQYAVDQIMAQARNEGKIASFKDATNAEQYNYNLTIRNREQQSLNEQYTRSDQLYNSQLSLNAMSAKAGSEDEINRHRDAVIENNLNARDAELAALEAEGKMRASGASGRGIKKGIQATLADYGRQLDMLDLTIASSGRAARAALDEIARDQTAADLAAYAQKMLAPGDLPMPIVPFATPMSEFVLPRALEEYDYGPAPVRGAMADPNAAASRAWGVGMTSVAGSVATLGKALHDG